jgi:hypothetical protein
MRALPDTPLETGSNREMPASISRLSEIFLRRSGDAMGRHLTEEKWNRCNYFRGLYDHLYHSPPCVSDRKLGLYAVACCRSVTVGHPDEVVLGEFLNAMERYLDGEVPLSKAAVAYQPVRERNRATFSGDSLLRAAVALFREMTEDPRPLVVRRFGDAPVPNSAPRGLTTIFQAHAGACNAAEDQLLGHGSWEAQEAVLLDLLRDICGPLPFREVPIEPAWLRRNDGTVERLARTIHEDRDWLLLPVLCDALEDAGCSDQDILTHGRSAGPHTRGCWVVDRLLGKT